MDRFTPTGIESFPQVKWGSHLTHFFERGDELRDLLVPYFKAGLENNERCLWVTGKQFPAASARVALKAVIPDLEEREHVGQIEIADFDRFYALGKKLQSSHQEHLRDDPGHRLADAKNVTRLALRSSGFGPAHPLAGTGP